MRAIIIAVGSEMLERGNVDTNSSYIGRRLMEKGILPDMKIVVGDDMENLTWTVKNACKRAQIVILTGGLGPTEDDITREAVAGALKKELEFRQEILDDINHRFRKRGLNMPQVNARQAFIIRDSEVLPNARGTAPGLYIDEEQNRVLLLPGPPLEMEPMFDRVLEEKIAPLSNFFIYNRSFKFGGITESELDARISGIYRKYKNPRTTILSVPGIIEVHLLGRSRKSADEAREPTDQLAEKIKQELADYLITERDIGLAEYILEELRGRGLTLATAESCTGGGLGHAITNVPGSSDVYLGGITAYSDRLKARLLGIDETLLEKKGAVSKEVAREMAHGIRRVTGADIGIGITGIAGPGGDRPGKPLGLVFMHISSENRDTGIYRIFPGDRLMVKNRTINTVLDRLRRHLNDPDK